MEDQIPIIRGVGNWFLTNKNIPALTNFHSMQSLPRTNQPQIPTFVGGHHHRHPKPRYPYHLANEDDTASDVHNLTDFSDDEDPLRNPRNSPRNSPRIPTGGAAKVKGSWYGDDHDMQSPSRRQLLNYRSPILQSGGGSRLA